MKQRQYITLAHWAVRLLLLSAVVWDALIVVNVVGRLVLYGSHDVVGYYQHMALVGVDLLCTPEAEIHRLVRRCVIRSLAEYAAFFGVTGLLIWAHVRLKRLERSPKPV
jgi:hypothetical protein